MSFTGGVNKCSSYSGWAVPAAERRHRAVPQAGQRASLLFEGKYLLHSKRVISVKEKIYASLFGKTNLCYIYGPYRLFFPSSQGELAPCEE